MALSAKKYESKSKFWDLWDQGVKQGKVAGATMSARNWYRDQARRISVGDVESEIFNVETHFKRKQILPGFMYMFRYDAVTKDKLPYWDMYPLVFPYRFYTHPKNGRAMMDGINLHYLPRPMRARLMDALHSITTNHTWNDNQRVDFAKNALENIVKFKHFSPCVHTYYIHAIKSKFYKIPGQYWDIALMLPTERFQKASKTAVWADSQKKISAQWGKQRWRNY